MYYEHILTREVQHLDVCVAPVGCSNDNGMLFVLIRKIIE
jgi:hypothetical protein